MDFSFLSDMGIAGFAILKDVGKGAGLGFLAGLLLAIVAGKLGLWRRSAKTHSMLVKLYYLYLPLAFAAFFAAWSGYSHMQSHADRMLVDIRTPVTELSLGVSDIALNRIQVSHGEKKVSVSEALNLTKEVVHTQVQEKIAGLPGSAQRVLKPAQGFVTEFTVGLVEDRLLKEAAGKLDIPEEKLATLWEDGIDEALRQGIVMDMIESQVHRKLASLARYLYLFGFLMIFPVALETGLFFYFNRSRKEQAGPGLAPA